MTITQLSLFPHLVKDKVVYSKYPKYETIDNNYFGFWIFEEIIKTIDKHKTYVHTQDTKIDKIISDVNKLKEEYYWSIYNQIINHE
jgi:hypothetical protein